MRAVSPEPSLSKTRIGRHPTIAGASLQIGSGREFGTSGPVRRYPDRVQ